MDAVFKTTGQALHASYLILSEPAIEKSAFRAALIRAMEATPKLTARQGEWLDQLRGTPSGRVNFEGLTMLEIRGQCCLVTSAVDSRLPTAERGVILARFAYGEQKGEGIQALVRFCRRSCGISAFAPVYLLIARHYAPKVRKEGLSLRDIAEKHGLSKRAVDTAARWMASHFAALELLAMQRLQAVFLADGLVEMAEDLGTLPAAPAPRSPSRRAVSRNARLDAAEEAISA
ncbi:hypothetical protein [Cupriavidus sp. USMAA2-4]|uniref:hypothetical protein n=1 Tax=Cupriavidus sp. USMAA2-4 TaxID=876364 RepID=UPI0012F4FC3D|nr:hypothetical protein [Cupriavidus sp. USMAA2-4]